MGDFGFRVSKAGFDVKSAADNNLVFTSKYKTFTIFSAGSGSISITSPTAVAVTLTHNLGYRPAAIVYSENTGVSTYASGDYLNCPAYYPVGGGDITIIPYVTTTTLVILYGGGLTRTLNYKYYIYYEQAI